MNANAVRRWARWPLAAVVTAGATAGVSALGAGVAEADEHYSGTTQMGPQFGLVRVGQVDDPMEDVLEHASILGGDTWTID